MASLRVLCIFLLLSLASAQVANSTTSRTSSPTSTVASPTSTAPPSTTSATTATISANSSATTAPLATTQAPAIIPTSIEKRDSECEGRTLKLNCSEGYLIQIQDAFFGRNDSVTCASSPSDSNMNCTADDPVSTLKQYCEGQTTCDIPVTVAMFGGRCSQVNTVKYLRVVYLCQKTLYNVLVCDGQGTIPIACPAGYLIETSSAFYGRQDATTCPESSPSRSTNCSSPNTLEVFKQLCDRRRECDAGVREDLFGDACPGVRKYLSASFSCVKCENAYPNDAQCEYWANTGQCQSNPTFMFPNCRKACWRCSETAPACVNHHPNDSECTAWANMGQCEKNPAWMIPFCMKSCLFCGQQQPVFECINKYSNETQCNEWAEADECQTNSQWMMANCMRSCVGCTESVPQCLNRLAAIETDGQGTCEFWARQGECETNSVFMRKNCWQSCTGCNGVPECANYVSDANCTLWASQNQCVDNKVWMMSYCFKSCMGCVPGVAKACTNFVNDNDCAQWALAGECRTNPYSMLHNCWKACTNCSQLQTCTNVNTNPAQCEYWANTGECQNNPYYMLPNCRASCTRCSSNLVTTECTNVYANDSMCDMWAQSGDCASNPAWMIPYCRKSCLSCDTDSSKISMIGNEALPGLTSGFTKMNTVILGDQFTIDAVIMQFSAFFTKNNTVKIQVFRPTGINTLDILHEESVTPQNNTAQIIKLQKCVQVRNGDRIGFTTTTNMDAPIAYNYDISAISSALSFRKANEIGTFTSLSMPFRFSLSAAYDRNSTC